MGRETIGELIETPTKPTIGCDVLTIDQRPRSDITLDSLNPKKEYLKSEPIGQTTFIQNGQQSRQVTEVGFFISQNSQ